MQSDWGRVGDDGTVFVKTSDGERSVGQYPEGSAEEALKFYTDRFEQIATEVGLLEQRVRAGTLKPDVAMEAVKAERERVTEASAVGDLASLAGKLDALGPVIATQRAHRKEERAKKAAETAEARQRIVAEAEKLASGTDFRHGGSKFAKLLDEWKALPRIEKSKDDALWKQFSAARSTFQKRRKTWTSEMDEKRDAAKLVKQRLAKEAEALATSTEWGPTSRAYRDLMRDWKAAGPAPKKVDDELWKRFRGAQDQFFAARDEANAKLDAEFAENAKVKDELIVKAEALLPITDLESTKREFRKIAAAWDEAGKVPRDRKDELEGRMRTVERALRDLEDKQWRRSDPEKSARANDMVTQLRASVAELEAKLAAAQEAGDPKKASSIESELQGKRAFLDAAEKASADFG